MTSPGRRFQLLKRRTGKSPLPSVKKPQIVVEGVPSNRIIRLPRFNRRGQLDGAVLIVRKSNRERVKAAVSSVKKAFKNRSKKVAVQ